MDPVTPDPDPVQLLVDFAEWGAPLRFRDPMGILTTRIAGEIPELLAACEEAARNHRWVAGFLTYEAAAAFDLPVADPDPLLPLAWFGIFEAPQPAFFPPGPPLSPWGAPIPAIPRSRYLADLARIHEHLLDGESYQVNYTLPARFAADPDPLAFFLHLQGRHRHPYAMYLSTPEVTVASLSPECFLSRRGSLLTSAPIKGTRPRSPDLQEDAALSRELRESAKERAEHVMIVDMARNDLGRIGATGSIRVERLFEERLFPSVRHLESRVHGHDPGSSLAQVMAALFPAASITGAPRVRTMAIIREREGRPRGIYTGSLGVIRPGGDFLFNVAIRTLVQTPGGRATLGLGGGIVADSEPEAEWREVACKGGFVTRLPPPLHLLETMRVEAPGVIPLWGRHWRRLADSARALGFPCTWEGCVAAVREALERLRRQGAFPRVLRLALAADGALSFTDRPVASPVEGNLRVSLSRYPVDHRDRLLRHKTDRRQLFDAELARARRGGYDEVFFQNGRGEITEGAIRAVAVRLEEGWFVPAIDSGVLASLWRAGIRESLAARERSITLADLRRAREILCGNAVQGTVAVGRVDDGDGGLLWELPPTSP
ncbi:MAG: bifunctional anthranilate synthase component I family protein/class IV aminotransferase [Magnetococcales bacterium]|nr:bifunctional anthranilate synthase component I family protein/class IV aminotransferase [Magnetococcales bacterium]